MSLFRRYALITAGAAACAFGVLAAGALVVLPMVCQNGYSPDECLVQKVEAPVAEIAAAPAAAPVVQVASVAALAPHEPIRIDDELRTRVVKVVTVRPQDSGLPPIVGQMAVPYPADPAARPVIATAAAVEEAPALEEPVAEVAAIAPVADAPAEETQQQDPGVDQTTDGLVMSGAANVRSGPSRSAPKLFALDKGEQVAALGKDKGWVHIEDDQGRKGWVYSDYVE